MSDLFHYYCGTPVRAGDRVRLSEWDCVIEHVIAPRTDYATAFSCEETGGVLVSIPDGETLNSFMLMEPPDREQWEDLHFIARATQF